MDEGKKKAGVSVKEIEAYAKKHRFEVVFILALVLACFFSFVFFWAGWGILLGAIGGITGVLFPQKTVEFGKKVFAFVNKQEQMVQIVLGCALLIFAVFLPFLIFSLLGLFGGSSLRHHASGM